MYEARQVTSTSHPAHCVVPLTGQQATHWRTCRTATTSFHLAQPCPAPRIILMGHLGWLLTSSRAIDGLPSVPQTSSQPQVILMDHLDWLDEKATKEYAAALARQVRSFC